MKDYYKILGVSENCSEADIKKAFRKLAFQHHPDTNPGNEKQAEAKFKEINEAYGVLGDMEEALRGKECNPGVVRDELARVLGRTDVEIPGTDLEDFLEAFSKAFAHMGR